MFSSATPDPDFTAYARSGCPAAFRRLVERHLPAVYSAARRTLGRHAAHDEDVAQSVFILLARKARALPPVIIVPAWLHRQAVRLSLNAVRSESRRRRRETAAAEAYVKNDSDEDALWRDLQPHVDQAMLLLPSADREALALRYLERKSLREVGETLGLSTDAAQKRVERALQKLRRHLAPHTAGALTLSALAGCVATRSVEAAPAHFSAAISGGALAAVPPATFLTTFIAVMTQTKALTLGALTGFLSAGAWTLWNPAAAPAGADQASAGSLVLSSVAPGSGRNPQADRYFPQAALTPEGILSQVQQILAEPDTEISRMRLRGLLSQLSSEQCGVLLILAVDQLPALHIRRFHVALIACWPGIDAPAAMIGYAGLAGPVNRMAPMVAAVFASWLQSDAVTAQQWIVDHQDDPAIGKFMPLCVAEVAKDLLADSEAALFKWARQMAGTKYIRAALTPLVQRLSGSENEAGALRELAGLLDVSENKTIRRDLMAVLIGYWSNRLPEDLASWITAQPPGEQSMQAAALAFASLQGDVWNDAKGYTRVEEWIRQQKPEAAASIIREGLLEAKQIHPRLLEDLRPWLNGPGREGVVLHVARAAINGAGRLSYPDPAAEAGILWAAELTNPTVRDPLIYGIYQQGLRNSGSKYIQDLPDKINLPEELRAILHRAKSEL